MASPLSPKGSSHYRIRLFQVKDFIIKVIPRDLQTKKTSCPHPHPKIQWWGRSRITAGDTAIKRGWNWNWATSQLLQSSWAPTDPLLWGQGHPSLEAGSFSWKWLLVHCSRKLLDPLSLRFFLFYKKWPCLQLSSFLAWFLPGDIWGPRGLCASFTILVPAMAVPSFRSPEWISSLRQNNRYNTRNIFSDVMLS